MTIQAQQLTQFDLSEAEAQAISEQINNWLTQLTPQQCWQKLSKQVLTPAVPFAVHEFLYQAIYQQEDSYNEPIWLPDDDTIKQSKLQQYMQEKNFANYPLLHAWSCKKREQYWQDSIEKLRIRFHEPYQQICDLKQGIETPQWLSGTKLNIAESCFNADDIATAIVYQDETGKLKQLTYAELDKLSNRIANSLQPRFNKGDAIAIYMPMTIEAVAIYLGIIKAGCVAVSIADSFAADVIATRLRIAKAKAIFTQDVIARNGKALPLYEKVTTANAPQTIVIPANQDLQVTLRANDLAWEDFLVTDTDFTAISCEPNDAINILFSSGTTGDPKAIAWTQTTPIKCASDAYFHQDIHAGDVLAWPTNLGWMMGPWLLFAALINRATIALFYGAPTGRAFCEFVQNAKVTMLGVIPSLVNTWRQTDCMQGLDWHSIRVFTSTAECSNPSDMHYLSSRAGYKPIIEYCGGTEIGGAYLTSTVVQANIASTFSTPTLGLDLVLIDETGKETNNGEVALIPPSIGLSNELLNKDHHKIYYQGMPRSNNNDVLRRHGDQIERLANGYYKAQGRVDDTMNLGGIKVSSTEIERSLNTIEHITETAAIAVPPSSGGPAQLIVYAVGDNNVKLNIDELKKEMQARLKTQLNPLFKVHAVILLDALPRTASNKVMRRALRANYVKSLVS